MRIHSNIKSQTLGNRFDYLSAYMPYQTAHMVFSADSKAINPTVRKINSMNQILVRILWEFGEMTCIKQL